jgi:hypothetical protein
MKPLSVVNPCYNESANVETLTDRYDLLRPPVGDFISVNSSNFNAETQSGL